jgi:predicted RNA binding protein YcfA (HicA-like mRNA interferase family)
MTRRGSRKTLRDEKGQAWIPVKLRETVKQGTLKTMEAEYEEQRI